MIYSLEKCRNNYHSVNYGATALKIRHDTGNQKVCEQQIFTKDCKFNSIEVTCDLLIGKVSK